MCIGVDCDLAMLQVDEADFWKGKFEPGVALVACLALSVCVGYLRTTVEHFAARWASAKRHFVGNIAQTILIHRSFSSVSSTFLSTLSFISYLLRSIFCLCRDWCTVGVGTVSEFGRSSNCCWVSFRGRQFFSNTGTHGVFRCFPCGQGAMFPDIEF